MPDTAKLTIEFPLPDNLLNDLLVTAVEGGSNYWAEFRTCERDAELNIVRVTVTEWEPSGDIAKSMIITPADLLRGLQATIAEGEKRSEFTNAVPCVIRCLTENYDANDADIILQHAMFGELVYG